jgi:predicted AlkP superfamily phosphohydrolase/phosphomutase
MGSRIIAIGLEAAEPDLIEKWCEAGHLPRLAALKDRWPWMRILSTTTVSSGTTWPSIFTGTSPAKHGIAFYHRQLKTGTYRICKKYADQVKREPFWDIFSRTGMRSMIFDVPATRPMKGFNGVHIGGFGVEAPNWKRRPWPPDLVRDIKKRFGAHPLERWYQLRPQTLEEWGELQDKLISGACLKGAISKALLEEEPWDFFFTVYSESHWAGHYFWHVMDPSHPEHRTEEGSVYGNAILKVYQELDKALAGLEDLLTDSTILVFSNTGMGPNYSGVHLLSGVLERLGMGGKDTERGGIGKYLSFGKGRGNALPKIESTIPQGLIDRVKFAMPERVWDTLTRRILHSGKDWRSSKAFAIPNDYAGAIRINLKGREPHGLVAPGREYDALCDFLIEEIGRLVNPDTGKEAVSRVVRVDRLYRGENLKELPDLVVQWAGDAPLRALYSPAIGTVSGLLLDKRTGAHRPDGFLIAAGRHIRQNGASGRGNIMDIAPTVLYLMGQPIPKDMDGRVLMELIDDRYGETHPVHYS